MKLAVHLFLTAFILAMPAHALAMTPQEFDAQAIPLMSDPTKADALIKLCDQALADGARTDPEYEAFIHVMKSIAYLAKQDYDTAEAEARMVIDSGQQETLGYTAMMDILFARKKYDDGLAICLEGAKKAGSERNQEAARQDCHLMHLQATSTSPSALWNAYAANESEADKTYKTHPITLLGTASEVEENNGSIAKISFAADKSGGKNVVCVFDPKPTTNPAPEGDLEYSLTDAGPGRTGTGRLAPIGRSAREALPTTGETVIVSGNVQGLKGGSVILTGCSLARQ